MPVLRKQSITFKIVEIMNIKKKPEVTLTGKNGNVFNLLAICKTALKEAGQTAEADEMQTKVFNSGSYEEALGIMSEYCEVN